MQGVVQEYFISVQLFKMNTSIYYTRYLLISYLSYLAMGARANTMAYAFSMKSNKDINYEMKQMLLKSLASGAKLALEQCKSEFRWERWNCPESSFAKSNQMTTREKAFVTAISAAGFVYSVTRSCSVGDVASCGCTKPPDDQEPLEDNSSDKTWSWGGCSEDVTTGDLVSDVFLTTFEGLGADVLTRVNIHNARLGRLIVKENVRPECKCHGLSGSCTTKTCWRKIAPFHFVSSTLKNRYIRAQRVQVNRATRQAPLDIPEYQMVFLDESPDYCKPNNTTGWPGTGGRFCSRGRDNDDKSEKRSCRELCRTCGHQVKKRPITVKWYCNCSFQWCCDVKCKLCNKTIIQYYCDDTPQQY